MRTSEVLNTAADLIEERGWGQGGTTWAYMPGVNENHSGPICLEGGIQAVVGIGQAVEAITSCPSYIAVKGYLADHPYWQTRGPVTFGWTRLYHWNDAPGRTAAEVIEVLRACALIESAREQDSAWHTYATNVARVTV